MRKNENMINAKDAEKFAVNYQVLSKHTNMIGVRKNKEKSAEVGKTVEIEP